MHLDGELNQFGAGPDAQQFHHGVLVEGDGPRVAIFDGKSLRPGQTPVKLVNDFFVFERATYHAAQAGQVVGAA